MNVLYLVCSVEYVNLGSQSFPNNNEFVFVSFSFPIKTEKKSVVAVKLKLLYQTLWLRRKGSTG